MCKLLSVRKLYIFSYEYIFVDDGIFYDTTFIDEGTKNGGVRVCFCLIKVVAKKVAVTNDSSFFYDRPWPKY